TDQAHTSLNRFHRTTARVPAHGLRSDGRPSSAQTGLTAVLVPQEVEELFRNLRELQDLLELVVDEDDRGAVHSIARRNCSVSPSPTVPRLVGRSSCRARAGEVREAVRCNISFPPENIAWWPTAAKPHA